MTTKVIGVQNRIKGRNDRKISGESVILHRRNGVFGAATKPSGREPITISIAEASKPESNSSTEQVIRELIYARWITVSRPRRLS